MALACYHRAVLLMTRSETVELSAVGAGAGAGAGVNAEVAGVGSC
jgi:hypothetical protein